MISWGLIIAPYCWIWVNAQAGNHHLEIHGIDIEYLSCLINNHGVWLYNANAFDYRITHFGGVDDC